MKIKSVPLSWIRRWGNRLDVEPYIGGAVEARVHLEQAKYNKERLRELTTGHEGGIYNGPMFRRNYVESRQYGVPFLTSGSMLKADLIDVGLLRRKDAESPKLAYLRLTAGTTLISCSGTVGRTLYTRPDMEGMWSSQDMIKVVPDARRIPPGYLFAFLSSRFGVPMVTSGTYGAIIQHIEPEHLVDLPVPRLGDAVEQKVHRLTENAAANRSEAAQLRMAAQDLLLTTTGLPDLRNSATPLSFGTFEVNSRQLGRLDAAFHSRACVQAALALGNSRPNKRLGDAARVFQTEIFKRPYVDDASYGYPYYSGSELFTYGPEPRGFLRKKAPGIDAYVVHSDWLLMQDAGQLGGLIGRVMRVGSSLDNSVVSNHLVRIVAASRFDAGFLFALLSSACGYRAVVRHAFGSSIPQLESAHLRDIAIPWPDDDARAQIAEPVLRSWDLEDEAVELDRLARATIEQAIEEAV